jgi:hypothetical protein
MVQYPTTQVYDGMPKPQIPLCVQRLNGLWYCYDDQGNLVFIGTTPSNLPPAPLTKSISQYPQIFVSNIQNPNGGFNLLTKYGYMCITGQIINYSDVFGSPFFGSLKYSGSVSVPVGTSNTYGSAQTIYNNNAGCICNCGYYITLPVYVTVTWGGSFASGETVTVELTFNISPIGSSSVSFSPSTTLSATATGSQSLNINNIIAVIAPAITTTGTNYTVSSVTAAAASSASSTSVTVSVQVWFLTS